MSSISKPAKSSNRLIILEGIAWNSFFQVFQTLLSFGTMLVLVRIIPPAEYGRAGAVVGILSLLNAFNCDGFMLQALQLPDDKEPDWSLHWALGFYIQVGLSLICHLIAGFCWLLPDYRPIALLLHLGAIGLLFDAATKLNITRLRREMNFKRFRIISACCVLVNLLTTLVLGLAGWGAYAIVIGGNVIISLPFTFHLLFIRNWRPQPGWWRWSELSSSREILRFGIQQVGSRLLASARGAVEAMILPGVYGFAAIGLFSRAQALFNTTIGTLANVLSETVYPLLPRSAINPQSFARHATAFAQAAFLLLFPGALFVGTQGAELSRLLYGNKWSAADQLILPGTIIGLSVGVFALSSSVLLAANRLRTCFVLSLVSTGSTLPMAIVALLGGKIVAYAWALAGGQLLAGMIALVFVSPLLSVNWPGKILLPPMLSSMVGIAVVLAFADLVARLPLIVHLLISGSVYVVMVLLCLRFIFPSPLSEVLNRLPGGERLRNWLLLVPSSPA